MVLLPFRLFSINPNVTCLIIMLITVRIFEISITYLEPELFRFVIICDILVRL